MWPICQYQSILKGRGNHAAIRRSISLNSMLGTRGIFPLTSENRLGATVYRWLHTTQFLCPLMAPHPLEICLDADDLLAEFKLEKRPVVRTRSGASQHLRRGDGILKTLFVKPAWGREKYGIEIMQRGVTGPISNDR